MTNWENTTKALESVGKEMRRRMRISLTKQGKVVSGTLYNSIKPKVESTKNGRRLVHEMAPYADFVNRGVQGRQTNEPPKIPGKAGFAPDQLAAWSKSPYRFGGGGAKMVPFGSIDRWSVQKGIEGTRDESGRFTPRKSIVRAISTRIYNKGIVPSLFFDRAYNTMYDRTVREVGRAVGLDYGETIKQIIEK